MKYNTDSLSGYIEYEKQVLNLLRERLLKDGISVDHFRINYRVNNTSRCDAVIVDDNGKPNRIFEIKTLQAVKHVNDFIKKEFDYFTEKIDKNIKVDLVFLDTEGSLNIINIKNLQNKPINDKGNKQVKSFADFISIIHNQYNDGNYEIQYFFRGQANASWDIIPSIYRNKKNTPSLIEYEDRMFHEAVRNSPSDFPDGMSTIDKLVKMQHYELPTRLLDITSNPLVALYFACCSDSDINRNGRVFIFCTQPEQRKYYDSDNVCILSNLTKMPISFNLSKDSSDLVYDIQQEKNNFTNNLESNDINTVFCVLPKLNNERIIRQAGAFFIFGIDGSKDKPAKMKFEYNYIEIKASAKNEILKDLSLFGVDEAHLFPEKDRIMKEIMMAFHI